MSNLNSRQWYQLAKLLVPGIIVLVIFLVMLVNNINALKVHRQRNQQYQAALLCGAPGSQADNCGVDTSLIVVQKWNKNIGYKSRDNDWWMELRSNNGADYNAEFNTGGYPPRVYRLAQLGTTVYAQLWHGDVMWISSKGANHFTQLYPGPIPGRDIYGLDNRQIYFGIFMLLFISSYLVFGVWATLRGK